jgi:hypothetical protein
MESRWNGRCRVGGTASNPYTVVSCMARSWQDGNSASLISKYYRPLHNVMLPLSAGSQPRMYVLSMSIFSIRRSYGCRVCRRLDAVGCDYGPRPARFISSSRHSQCQPWRASSACSSDEMPDKHDVLISRYLRNWAMWDGELRCLLPGAVKV